MAKAESCHNCVYAHWDLGLWVRTLRSGFPARPTCGNQPDFPGRMRECPLGRACRNFRPRPPTPTGETVKTIPLGEGFYAYVDAADYEWLSRWTWCLYGGYAALREKGKLILMHREITQAAKGMVVDHLNRNKLDNTRANLRNCTPAENARNRGKRQGATSRFIGVGRLRHCDGWYARVRCRGERFCLGRFTDEIEAARARDRKAVEVFGVSARWNFPEEWPPERRAEVYARFQARLKREGKKGVKSKRAKRKESKSSGRARPRATGHKSRATPARSRATRDQRRDKAKAKIKRAKGRKRA